MARVIGCIGVLAVAMTLFLFLFPQQAIDVWPWTLTPLTARVMGADLRARAWPPSGRSPSDGGAPTG